MLFKKKKSKVIAEISLYLNKTYNLAIFITPSKRPKEIHKIIHELKGKDEKKAHEEFNFIVSVVRTSTGSTMFYDEAIEFRDEVQKMEFFDIKVEEGIPSKLLMDSLISGTANILGGKVE